MLFTSASDRADRDREDDSDGDANSDTDSHVVQCGPHRHADAHTDGDAHTPAQALAHLATTHLIVGHASTLRIASRRGIPLETDIHDTPGLREGDTPGYRH